MSHVSFDELRKLLSDAHIITPVWSIRSHYKHPEKHYRIVDHVIDEASDEVAVVYSPVDDEDIKFVRLLWIFCEFVEKDNIVSKRFIRVT